MEKQEKLVSFGAMLNSIRLGDAECVGAAWKKALKGAGKMNTLWAAAAREGHLHIILDLVAISGSDNGGKNWALIVAVLKQHVPVVEVLLDNGADPNAYSGLPLREAALSANIGMARRLLQAGAVVDEKLEDEDRMSALHSAVNSGSLEMLQVLAEKSENLQNSMRSLLHLAAKKGDVPITAWLLNQGSWCGCDNSLLWLEAARNTPVLELLAERMGCPSQEVLDDMMERMAKNGLGRDTKNAVSWVLKRGASPLGVNSVPLRTAVSYGKWTMAKLLVKRGASPASLQKKGVHIAENARAEWDRLLALEERSLLCAAVPARRTSKKHARM